MKTLAFLLLVAPLIAAACSTSTTNGGSGSCSMNMPCPDGQICGFAQSEGCSARGLCFPAPQAVCTAYAAGCACDGSVINIACTGLPIGYYAKALSHTGVCADGCSAEYPCISTTPCTTDADCAAMGSQCDPCTHTCWCSPSDAGGEGGEG